MPISPDFPKDPYVILPPEIRWYPGEEALFPDTINALMPPLVAKVRQGVHEWRAGGYQGCSTTTKALLSHWFDQSHEIEYVDDATREFKYYFAQREAVEAAVWLYEVEKAREPYSLMKYDSTGRVARGMFAEDWCRYVFKLATGVGKTKVLSLLMAWSYFHKIYETNSDLSTNFLLIAPNIIVLDRLKDDFEGLRIFQNDPVIPSNGYAGRNWHDDFQVSVHLQDEIGRISTTGNLFLTNIHRIYEGPAPASLADVDLTNYFLGVKPTGKTTDRGVDLGNVVRTLNDLVILNDEAHHIHDPSLAWFRAIEDLSLRLRQKGSKLSAQFDVTATPRHDNGAVFVETVCSYPLVEAIRQGIVKVPVLPDEASRSKLVEHPSNNVAEQFADHIKLGYLEWRKYYDELLLAGKKAILFVMTTVTRESDEVAQYMRQEFPDLAESILVIHTNSNGEIKEGSSGKAGKEELERLREASRSIDDPSSPYKVVISVLMLREGWDVKNVVAMVGLRPFTAQSNILPEQTLGRGLRRMFRDSLGLTEYVSIVGTPAFLDFVESIRSEGVELGQVPMGPNSQPLGPLAINVDRDNTKKNIDALDIELPQLSPRIERQTKNFDDINLASMDRLRLPVRQFTEQEQREIVFREMDTEEVTWMTDLGQDATPIPQVLIAYFVNGVMRHLHLVGGQDILFGKMKAYVSNYLFEEPVDLNDLNVVRNLSETSTRTALHDAFIKEINSLRINPSGSTFNGRIKFSDIKPYEVSRKNYFFASKSVFDKLVCDNDDEMLFATFLEHKADDVASFVRKRFPVVDIRPISSWR